MPSTVTAVQSASAAVRLGHARAFLQKVAAGEQVLLLGASRGSADDLARTLAAAAGASFGIHRLSFTQLAARLAAAGLAVGARSASSALGHEAVAARATFEASRDGSLGYFSAVTATPGFSKALARTLLELRLAGFGAAPVRALRLGGSDLAELLDRVEALMEDAGSVDRASLFTLAAEAPPWPPMPTVLLDVPFDSAAETAFLRTVLVRAPLALVTVPAGDHRTVQRLRSIGIDAGDADRGGDPGDLSYLGRFLFADEAPPEREQTGELVWFSAPGEGRECVEIARRMLKEASAGVPFDQMALFVRSPQQYIGVLEHALGRAGIPAYFDRGIRRPDPSGRAFLALLSCAAENLSARRFAEYLSLGQVPSLDGSRVDGEAVAADAWVSARDEAFGVLSERAEAAAAPDGTAETPAADDREAGDPAAAVVSGTLRAPWKWEALLVESAVIGGRERWARRLDGLAEEYRVRIRALRDDEPDSSRIPRLERELQNLDHLRAFALPLMETMGGWPEEGSWGEWLLRLDALAPRVLRRPADVLRVLADLRPMASVGPVSLAEVRDVLAGRLLSVELDPPASRYGRVFVGSPHQARGRAFRIVFVPGLAERLFPQKVREDPLLLDELRGELGAELPQQTDRGELERLLLRLAAGAATERLYVSFPRLEISEARARVPSFYALEIMRAATGRVPDHVRLQQMAAEQSRASLAWPAPEHPGDAIDDLEHDLAVLRRLMTSPDEVKGRARYLLALNDCLKRSVTERWARAEKRWSQFDGLVRATGATRPFLAAHRLQARPYSVSALQRYAACPYQFFLASAYRLAPQEQPEPLQRMDPLTRGSLFHQVQAEVFRALQREEITISAAHLPRVLELLDETLARVAADYRERLAPAIERVWDDEIAAMRTDLRVWIDRMASNADWEPWLFEFAFGLPGQPGHDPMSLRDPVVLGGRFLLRGSVDLVERKAAGSRVLRVTDHKTSKNRSRPNSKIGGGAQLQPIVYSLAVEQATGATVESARFSYCTTAGGFTEHAVPIDDRARRLGLEVLEIVDRAVEHGMLPPAPNENACVWCDFLPVCGPDQARRAARKSQKEIGDLIDLRGRP